MASTWASESSDKWTKPSIVVMGESNYSDAHLFPVAYKTKGVGRTLGMPRARDRHLRLVGGRRSIRRCASAFPWAAGAARTAKFCENTQLEPDVLCANEPDVLTAAAATSSSRRR